MTVSCYSISMTGLDPFQVNVEVDVSVGKPCFSIVGLGDTAIQESKERVWSAIRNSQYHFPLTRKTINLAPSDTRKMGSHYDLAMGVGLLAASNQCPSPPPNTVFFGELGLDGEIRPIKGILALVLGAKLLGFKKAIISQQNIKEASLVRGIKICAARNLTEVVESFNGQQLKVAIPWKPKIKSGELVDLRSIQGQRIAKRALEIAAVGGHSLLMYGPPGSGKTLLAQALCGILPELTWRQTLSVTKIHSVVGMLPADTPVITTPPLRQPHHGSSGPALVGGGNPPHPGEITLAQHGVLFLDELPLFQRSVLDALREPLENGWIQVSRTKGSVKFPAKIILVAAMNPCPCGPQPSGCVCSSKQKQNYLSKISGPLLDRIDMIIPVEKTKTVGLVDMVKNKSSQEIKKRLQFYDKCLSYQK